MSSPKKSSLVRIAIIGTGGMAHYHVRLFKEIRGCQLVAAVDVDLAKVTAFAKDHGIAEVYTSVDELLSQSEFDAVSIVTPDPYHMELSIACLKAGKHVLCEKPLALNLPDAKRMVAAAKKAKVINMVHFTYRNMPALQAVAKLVQSGKIGEVRHVEASYHQAWLVSKAWGEWRTNPSWLWRLSSEHGSKGVLGDVGVHILDFATFPAGKLKSLYCKLKTFKKAPRNRIGEYKLDANDTAVITAEFANGAIGSIQATRWMTGHTNRLFLKIAGTKGSVEIDSDRSQTNYRICRGADIDLAKWKDVEVKPTPNLHKRFIRSIRTGQIDQADFARGAEIQKLLDASFESDALGAPVKLR